MKKYFVLTIIFLLLNSCSVQKKQYYIFDRYVPRYGNATKAPAQRLDEKIELNLTPVNKNAVARKEQEGQATTQAIPEMEVVKPNTLSVRGDKIRKLNGPVLQDEEVKTLSLRPVEKIKERKNGDRLLLMAASVIGIAVMGLTRGGRPIVTQLTRWAKANPKTTQGLIAGMHLPLLGLGIMNGYNLNQLGYEVSDTLMYGFGAATAVGFLAAPHLPNHNIIVLPRTVNRQRLAFLGITLSSLMMMVGFGSKIEKTFPNTYLTSAVQTLDRTMVKTSQAVDVNPVEGKKRQSNERQERKANAGMSAGAAFFLTFLLVVLACTGICLVIGGFGGAFATGGASVAAVIGGLGLLAFSIWGIDRVSRQRKLEKEREKAEGL